MPDTTCSTDAAFGLKRFVATLREPERTQTQVLHSILRANAGCEFGRAHGFDSIHGSGAFCARVPIATYDDIRGDIDRMARGEPGILVAEPVCAWEATGGSGGGSKLVPYTRSGLAGFQAGLVPWIESLQALVPAAFAGRAYWSISPATRAPACTQAGMPIGLPSDAAYFGEHLAARILPTLAVPPEVGSETDVERWRRRTLAHLVACDDLALVSVWSPTFLLELLRALAEDPEGIARMLLEEDAPDGDFAASSVGPDHRRRRADLLLEIVRERRPDWSRLWSRLALVSCWDHARAEPWARELAGIFPSARVQGKGLLATEALVTIPVDADHDPVVALESGYFEFLAGGGSPCMVHEVEAGVDYELLLTTASGLYRYAIGDWVRVTGFIERTPTLRFLGRGGIRSDLCGEKLEDAFVESALRGVRARYAMLVADAPARRYVLVLDAGEGGTDDDGAASRLVDAALCANPQYAHARRMGQLGSVVSVRVADPMGTWLARGIGRGQRLGDIKVPALCGDEDAVALFGIGA